MGFFILWESLLLESPDSATANHTLGLVLTGGYPALRS